LASNYNSSANETEVETGSQEDLISFEVHQDLFVKKVK